MGIVARDVRRAQIPSVGVRCGQELAVSGTHADRMVPLDLIFKLLDVYVGELATPQMNKTLQSLPNKHLCLNCGITTDTMAPRAWFRKGMGDSVGDSGRIVAHSETGPPAIQQSKRSRFRQSA